MGHCTWRQPPKQPDRIKIREGFIHFYNFSSSLSPPPFKVKLFTLLTCSYVGFFCTTRHIILYEYHQFQRWWRRSNLNIQGFHILNAEWRCRVLRPLICNFDEYKWFFNGLINAARRLWQDNDSATSSQNAKFMSDPVSAWQTVRPHRKWTLHFRLLVNKLQSAVWIIQIKTLAAGASATHQREKYRQRTSEH